MSYNGSGTFTNPYNWNNDKTNGVLITASRMQTQDDGIATGLSTAICKDGQQTCTAQIPFAVGISVNAGTAMAPSVGVIGDVTTGFYQSATGAVDIACSGVRVGGFTSAGLVNTAISGTTGAFASLTVSGNVAVNTNKFTVNGSTGNTAIAGTLGVTGNVAVNTNKFNVTASSGNTSIAGTVTITPFSTAGIVLNNSSGVLSSATALPSGTTATTQSTGDNSTKVATTAYADAAKKVFQTVFTETGAVSSGSTAIPYDDTIPQNTEGDQYMSLAITPTSATNKLIITVQAVFSISAQDTAIMSLCQDSTASSLAATPLFMTSSNIYVMTLTHTMTAGTTSATTFKVRVGSNGGQTMTFNGLSASRKLGGVAASSIVIQEVAP